MDVVLRLFQSTLIVGALWALPGSVTAADPITEHFPEAVNSGCMKCHAGIELIREPDSEMMQQIMQRGTEQGDPAGCIICHGGDPTETTDKIKAHGGEQPQTFYPAPASSWVNQKTCGQCHPDQVKTQWTSLMMTEAGKIQGVCWAFGSMTGYNHLWANYAVKNPADPGDRLGTITYRQYMERLKRIEPNVFVDAHEPLPEALKVDELYRLRTEPTQAAFTYIREECQRCHHAVKGRQTRGDFRGIGCASCHTPYSNDGHYEGGDPSIDKQATGHMLVHSIQGTRDAKVTVHEKTYSGIPVETCTTCHARGKRIGVSFQGLMETPYHSPFAKDGGPQPALHTKHYIAMEQDVHYLKGMTCQDCHTTTDVHSDGFLAAANLASVQIECADCHGTPDRYPWDLPLGFMDEFAMTPATGKPRGVTTEPLEQTRQGTVHEPLDGYLITARGNPYENVVRDGNEIIVHTAAGKDIRMQPLKKLFAEKKVSQKGVVAMQGVAGHLERMECYTCHSSWTPQCYGCHIKIDYSQKDKCPECKDSKQGFDWVAAGRKHQDDPAHRTDRGETDFDTMIPGEVSEQRSYLRWEEPMLGINGEGRVTPLAPGCQPSVTLIGEDGKPILLNHIFKTDPGLEQGGEEGQLAIDMSPTQPHTTTKDVRSCESCHASRKALGLGIDSVRAWDKEHVVDLETVDGEILPNQFKVQMEPIKNLDHDWSTIVDEAGKQVATVGHHFQLSRAFNKEEQLHISREGTCVACHKEIPEESLAVSFLHHVAKYSGQLPKENQEHGVLVNKIVLMSAWLQFTLALGLPIGIGFVAWRWRRRNKLA
ncbi:Doubled CXXCH motif [Symmachiella macrocystis]|uniref:Doubled CXXCH motif n=1 Tax=Symmachiella macrocystis TaxID=2527985 RepID=A0A5C6B224_9PLAN|nr:cytochrome c3 family protein [Symmachiella macrocystis]TWU05286.1 Doubled CXXCH motif [Symmachiella macrocystis]